MVHNLQNELVLATEYTGSTSKQAGPMASLAFGAIAGLLGQSSSYPLDIVRRRMQTSPISGTQYKTILGTLKKIYRYDTMYCYCLDFSFVVGVGGGVHL